ncbi:TPA: translation elongation factor-like protein [archaeon]|nr:translation elongation factor-like protein [Candidatus Naiadarchaeales archaeon SRR2090153.bin1042]
MEKPVGKVFSFYNKISVAAVGLTDTLNIGEKVHFRGATTDFIQTVDSMQIEGKNVATAGAGEQIGVKVKGRVRPNDMVYKC